MNTGQNSKAKEVIEALLRLLPKDITTKVSNDYGEFVDILMDNTDKTNPIVLFCEEGIFDGLLRSRSRELLNSLHIHVAQDAQSFEGEKHISLAYKSADSAEHMANMILELVQLYNEQLQAEIIL